jgi:hypothetical protein
MAQVLDWSGLAGVRRQTAAPYGGGIFKQRENALTMSKGTHAIATFHAPPWCPPAMIFFRLMMTGAALDCVPISTTFILTQDQG